MVERMTTEEIKMVRSNEQYDWETLSVDEFEEKYGVGHVPRGNDQVWLSEDGVKRLVDGVNYEFELQKPDSDEGCVGAKIQSAYVKGAFDALNRLKRKLEEVRE